MKKQKYIAYNKLYYNGKAISKPFKTSVGESKEKLEKEVKKENIRWNKLKQNKDYKVKFVKIIKK
jgi:hypothetical protein